MFKLIIYQDEKEIYILSKSIGMVVIRKMVMNRSITLMFQA